MLGSNQSLFYRGCFVLSDLNFCFLRAFFRIPDSFSCCTKCCCFIPLQMFSYSFGYFVVHGRKNRCIRILHSQGMLRLLTFILLDDSRLFIKIQTAVNRSSYSNCFVISFWLLLISNLCFDAYLHSSFTWEIFYPSSTQVMSHSGQTSNRPSLTFFPRSPFSTLKKLCICFQPLLLYSFFPRSED